MSTHRPRELLYDMVLELARESLSIDMPMARQMIAAMEVARGRTPDLERVDKRLQRDNQTMHNVRGARVYALVGEVVALALETGERATVAAVAVPETPVLPLWVEFLDTDIGTEGERYCAILFSRGETREIGVGLSALQQRQVVSATFFTGDLQSKVLSYLPGDTSGALWGYQQQGRCGGVNYCQLAARTSEGEPYHVYGHGTHPVRCTCWASGNYQQHFVWALLHLLTAEGATHTTIDRTQVVDPHKPKHVRRRQQEEVDVYNRTHPRYIEISLSQKVHVRARRSPGEPRRQLEPVAEGEAEAQEEYATREVQIRRHARLLIPGPDKPWRGEVARIVWVRGSQFTRRTRTPATPGVRYLVTP